MPHYQGQCHCGAVKFRFSGEPINKGLRCNCSLCQRKGAMMTSYATSPDDMQIEAADGDLSLYQFGLKTAKHYFCKHCGIYTFHETARQPGYFRFNLGCIDGVDPFTLESDLFDGRNLL